MKMPRNVEKHRLVNTRDISEHVTRNKFIDLSSTHYKTNAYESIHKKSSFVAYIESISEMRDQTFDNHVSSLTLCNDRMIARNRYQSTLSTKPLKKTENTRFRDSRVTTKQHVTNVEFNDHFVAYHSSDAYGTSLSHLNVNESLVSVLMTRIPITDCSTTR